MNILATALVVAWSAALVLSDGASVADAQVALPREPVYALDGRAIVGANRIIARTRFIRTARSPIIHELAVAAAHQHPGTRGTFEQLFLVRLRRFLLAAPRSGLRVDDAGDARAFFIQVAFKIVNGRGFGDQPLALSGPGLWGEGAIAHMTAASSSLARLAFVLQLKFVMGANRRFAALSNAGKQRVYDAYALAATLLTETWQAATAGHDRHALDYVRGQARRQLRADLGVDPDRVTFTNSGIEVR